MKTLYIAFMKHFNYLFDMNDERKDINMSTSLDTLKGVTHLKMHLIYVFTVFVIFKRSE